MHTCASVVALGRGRMHSCKQIIQSGWNSDALLLVTVI
jgi:hypothetical protein